jgi:hypothetical protein
MTAALLLLTAQTMAAPLPEVKLEKLKEIAKKLPQRRDKLRAELAEAEKKGFFSREDAMIRFRTLLREIDSFEKDVSMIRLEIHRTELELVRSKVDLKALHEAIEKDKGIITQRRYVEVLKKKIKDTETAAQPDKVAKLTASYRRDLKSAEDYIRRRTKELEDLLAEQFERGLQLDGTSSTAKKWERYKLLQELIRNFGPPLEEFKQRAARLRDLGEKALPPFRKRTGHVNDAARFALFC